MNRCVIIDDPISHIAGSAIKLKHNKIRRPAIAVVAELIIWMFYID
jgi:hypothetical protein